MAQSTGETRPVSVASVNITGLNLRKDFDPDKLKELGESLQAKGQLAPIIVRAMNGGATGRHRAP
jgi:ParB-like chromosome segregation protein Spo0J